MLNKIPSINKILNHKDVKDLYNNYSRNIIVDIIKQIVSYKRQKLLKNEQENIGIEDIIDETKKILKDLNTPSLKRVINCTGVIINTNLGRAPLNPSIMKHVTEISCGYSNLEYDLNEGKRGSRYSHLEKIIKIITNAESVLVVNNNAAAVLLIIDTLAKNREVIVSRGELIEIGGSFRLPEIITNNGAKLIEVGTTNKTYISDYEKVINDNTALLLKTHTSNYKIIGFTETVSTSDLVNLGKKYNIPVVEDLGSGVLIDLSKYGLPYEPTVQSVLESGIDLVTFSGDKLLGGPQAGIILGKKSLIDRLKKNPLNRAMRVDKMCIAAVEYTFMLYLNEKKLFEEIPIFRMCTKTKDEIKSIAFQIVESLKVFEEKIELHIIEGSSRFGGGALPESEIPTFLIGLRPKFISTKFLGEKLRLCDPPIICRIDNELLLIDSRTLLPGDEKDLIKGIIKVIQ